MTTPAATLRIYDQAHVERYAFGYRTQAGADRAAQRIASDLRRGLASLILLDEVDGMPPCRIDAKGLAYVRVTYHYRAPAAPAHALVPLVDHRARASGERDD